MRAQGGRRVWADARAWVAGRGDGGTHLGELPCFGRRIHCARLPPLPVAPRPPAGHRALARRRFSQQLLQPSCTRRAPTWRPLSHHAAPRTRFSGKRRRAHGARLVPTRTGARRPSAPPRAGRSDLARAALLARADHLLPPCRPRWLPAAGAWPRRRLVTSGAGPCFAVHATCPVPPGEAAGGRRRECLPCTVLTPDESSCACTCACRPNATGAWYGQTRRVLLRKATALVDDRLLPLCRRIWLT